jgi:hypothetical protein
MSLPRVSYLESWEHNPASIRRHDQPSLAGSDDDAAYQELPEGSLSSSFPSTFSFPVSRQRLNFNPYAGPGWNEASIDDAADERSPLQRVSPQTSRPGRLGEMEGEDRVAQNGVVKPQETSLLEPIGAFEVGRTKRICKLVALSVSMLPGAKLPHSAGLYGRNLLFPSRRDCLRLRGAEACLN